VVVDRFTKYAHFLALKHPFTVAQVAQLLLDHVVKLHGLPKSMVNDRDKDSLNPWSMTGIRYLLVPSGLICSSY
jgi:hypothetical protein